MAMAMGVAREQDQVQILLMTRMAMDGLGAAMDHGAILTPGAGGADSVEAVLLMATLMIGDTGMTHITRTTLVQGETLFISAMFDQA